MLARRRGGIAEQPDEAITPLDVARPLGTGTMAEGVGGRLRAAALGETENGAERRERVGAGEPS